MNLLEPTFHRKADVAGEIKAETAGHVGPGPTVVGEVIG